MTTAILNQQTVTPNDQLMSLALFGFACFTSFHVKQFKVKGLSLHLERLHNDTQALFGKSPSSDEIIANVKAFLAQQDNADDVAIRVTIFPAQFSLARPGDFEKFNILVTGRAVSNAAQSPLNLASIEAVRSTPLQKTVNMLSPLQARAKAQQQGADDALLLDNGVITEGPTWNIFFGKDQQLVTPSLDCGLLPGVTRTLLIESTNQAGFEVSECKLKRQYIQQFDYCFASNAIIGLKPIASIDDIKFDIHHSALKDICNAYMALPEQHFT